MEHEYISDKKAGSEDDNLAGLLDIATGSTLLSTTSFSDLTRFGLIDDCPLFEGLYEYMTYVAGASLTAVEELIQGSHLIIYVPPHPP